MMLGRARILLTLLRRARGVDPRQARRSADRAADEALLEAVQDPTWWDGASDDDVARAYEAARTWRDADPRAAAAERTISRELTRRHGIDLVRLEAGDEPSADPHLLRAEADLHRGDAGLALRHADAAERARQTGEHRVDVAELADQPVVARNAHSEAVAAWRESNTEEYEARLEASEADRLDHAADFFPDQAERGPEVARGERPPRLRLRSRGRGRARQR